MHFRTSPIFPTFYSMFILSSYNPSMRKHSLVQTSHCKVPPNVAQTREVKSIAVD